MRREPILKVIVFVLVFVPMQAAFSGCILNGKDTSHLKTYYTLTAKPDRDRAERPGTDRTLFVMDFSISPEYSGNSFVYKKNNQVITDYYNRFIIAPDKLIKAKCSFWLDQASIFNTVLSDNRIMKPGFVLTAKIGELACDISQSAAPKAKIEISFILIDHEQGDEIVLNTTIKAERTFEEFTPETLVTKYNQCLAEIFTILEGKIAERFDKPLQSLKKPFPMYTLL